MNSTPPIARLMTSFVFGAVWPTYWPTRTSRVATTRWPLRAKPSWFRILAIRIATVVLPVPGRPVKLMCRVGRSVVRPRCSRTRATRSSAAISRIRVLIGVSPISSRSSSSSSCWMLDARNSAPRSTRPASAARAASVLFSVALPLGALRRVGVQGVPHHAILHFLTLEPESRLVLRAIDEKTQRRRLAPVGAVVAVHLDVKIGKRLPAGVDLEHDGRRILQVEHRQRPHVPERVARMRIVGVLDRHRPVVVDAVLDLRLDLLLAEVWQIGKCPLGDPHGRRLAQTVRVGTASGTSVDS